jgi:tetratricopeptide (TPR) repeat protein
MGDLGGLSCRNRSMVARMIVCFTLTASVTWADDVRTRSRDASPASTELVLTLKSSEFDSQSLVGADSVAAELQLGRGVLEFEQGKYAEALKAIEEAGPAGAGAGYYRGLCLLALRRAREALRELEVVRQHPAAPSEVELDVGVAQLAAGDAPAAEVTLKGYVAAHPDDPYGHYFLGVALFRQRRDREALEQFQLASTDTALAPYSDLYRGLSSYAQGDAGFRQYLDRYGAAADRIGPAADLARRLGSPMGLPIDMQVPADRRWNLSILGGYEFDTNVAQSPNISGLGSGTDEQDSRFVLASYGEYRFVQNEDCVAGLIGSTYSGSQFQVEEFDSQDYMGGVYSNVALGDFILGARYEFHDTLLDQHQFTTDHRVTPNVTYREGDFGHITAFYEFERLDVEGLALVPAQRRSGDMHALGVTQAFYLFDGSGRLFLGYRFEQAFTDGSDFDRHTNMLTARVEVPLPCKMVGDAEVRQAWDDYDNPNSLDFFDRPRNDRRIEARLGLQKFFTSHLSARLDYVYTMNDSNITNLFGSSFYSYDRHVLGTLLIYDF